MSTIKVIVVTVEGGVDDVVQVCEQLRLSVPLPAAASPVAAARPEAPAPQSPPAHHAPAPSTPALGAAPPPPAIKPTVREHRRAHSEEADGVRDVRVPPHESLVRRPRRQLLDDLAAVLPIVGDTVKVREFVRDDAEIQVLKATCNKASGDPRFRWMPGVAGGTRPARIQRVQP